jgi:hypothetical protein
VVDMNPMELPIIKVVPRDQRVMRGRPGEWMMWTPNSWMAGPKYVLDRHSGDVAGNVEPYRGRAMVGRED